jgi:hypothetical protein
VVVKAAVYEEAVADLQLVKQPASMFEQSLCGCRLRVSFR